MKYQTPRSFEMALAHHLDSRRSATGMPIDRQRQLIAFDRLTARFTAAGLRYLVKGGFVLELRLDRARTTRDVDVSLYGDPTNLADRITDACALADATDATWNPETWAWIPTPSDALIRDTP